MIIRHTNFDKTVNNIEDRNSIIKKVDGMIITVIDASGDPDVVEGKAVYRYIAADNTWVAIYKGSYLTMEFVTEELTIQNNGVILSNVPMDNVIWNLAILDGYNEIAFPRAQDLIFNLNTINLNTSNYNGYTFRVTYGYGTVLQQLNVVLDTKADADSTYTKAEIDAALTNAVLGNTTLDADLDAEVARATAAESTITSNLTVEVARATAAESTIASNLTVEGTVRASSDASIVASLNAEVSRATAAESALISGLSNVYTKTEVDDALSDFVVDAYSKSEMDTTVSSLTSTVNSEGTVRASADASIVVSLNAEVTRATAAESALNSNLNAEVTRATAAESALTSTLNSSITSSITVEATARASADASIIASFANKAVLDLLSDVSGTLYYNGAEISGGGETYVAADVLAELTEV